MKSAEMGWVSGQRVRYKKLLQIYYKFLFGKLRERDLFGVLGLEFG